MMNSGKAQQGQSAVYAERRGGFTLVELLAVMTIILLLAGLVIGGSTYATRKADIARCAQRMELIKNALIEYKIDNGSYPAGASANTLCSALLHGTGLFPKQYLTTTNFVVNGTLMDPWGKPFQYQAPSMHAGGGYASAPMNYDLWSYGPDGQPNTADDINNWSSTR